MGLPEDQIDDICICQMGECLDSIFGFKVGKKKKNGKNFYESCFELTNHEGLCWRSLYRRPGKFNIGYGVGTRLFDGGLWLARTIYMDSSVTPKAEK